MNFSEFCQIQGLRKMNIANSESFLIKRKAIFRFFDKYWVINMYHKIYLRKKGFF